MAGQLLPGENLILKLHQHWIFVAKSLLIPIALLLLVVVADIVLGSTSATNIRLPLTLAIVAIALLWLIVVWIRWQSIVYTLTDQRIKLESGVFSRSEKIIPIDRIQDCTTRQSLLGRVLGYGRVEVDAAGAQGAEVLEHLPRPGVFRDHVFLESRLLPDALQSGAVAALGGGTVMDDANWRLIRQRSMAVYLELSFEAIWERIGRSENRPLIAGRLRREVADLFERRRPRYEEAAYRVDADRSPDEVATDL